jgi:uracil-DNA glycosylase
MMPEIQLSLLFGQYALKRYLGDRLRKNLTETVRNWKDYQPDFLPMPHPSPRNQIWERKNPWFAEEVLPYLRERVSGILDLGS